MNEWVCSITAGFYKNFLVSNCNLSLQGDDIISIMISQFVYASPIGHNKSVILALRALKLREVGKKYTSLPKLLLPSDLTFLLYETPSAVASTCSQ